MILFFLIVFKKTLAILKPKESKLVLVLAIPTGATIVLANRVIETISSTAYKSSKVW